MIYWAGTSSDDVGAVVEYYPSLPRPRRKYSTITVPGRNGVLLLDENAYENYTQPYDIYIRGGRRHLPQKARAVAGWLHGPQGYQKLEDSYEPDLYRMAYYEGPTDIENILNSFGRATIEFNCKPQRFLHAGDRTIRLESPGTLANPTDFQALPLITVYGSGAGVLAVGGVTMAITSISSYVVLDSDTQNAYKGTENKNSTISGQDFPTLPAGNTAISWSGGITAVEIVPRWWTL